MEQLKKFNRVSSVYFLIFHIGALVTLPVLGIIKGFDKLWLTVFTVNVVALFINVVDLLKSDDED